MKLTAVTAMMLAATAAAALLASRRAVRQLPDNTRLTMSRLGAEVDKDTG